MFFLANLCKARSVNSRNLSENKFLGSSSRPFCWARIWDEGFCPCNQRSITINNAVANMLKGETKRSKLVRVTYIVVLFSKLVYYRFLQNQKPSFYMISNYDLRFFYVSVSSNETCERAVQFYLHELVDPKLYVSNNDRPSSNPVPTFVKYEKAARKTCSFI